MKRVTKGEKVPATKSGASGQSRRADYLDLVAGTLFFQLSPTSRFWKTVEAE